jgi:serine/threonine protein kinase
MLGELRSGAQVDGFTLGASVHGGAQGRLFSVTKHGVDRALVMKLPRISGDEASESLVAFETEAMIVPTLKGPHVAKFVAAGDLSQTPYLVMEWVEGRTLEAMLASAPLAPSDVARIGEALAQALHSVHQQDVIHLDVKPDNVILRPDGTAVLIDFGFAHHALYPDLLAEETRVRAGSAPYVSPEQLLGIRDDRRSDLFALGVLLYELATAKLPFGEADTDVRNRFWLEPVPPSALSRAFPAWLQEIILRCLEPRAELRYQSAAHVAFDLSHPEQVVLTARSNKTERTGLISHIRRFFRARAQHGAQLRSPMALPSKTPIVLVAVDTTHIEDERHAAIRFAISQTLALAREFRLICLTVIPDPAVQLEHLVRLRHWAAPLDLPGQRLSLHAIESNSPADVIVELARHNNVDLVVLGAPSEGGRAWSLSVASAVAARVGCSVHLVRLGRGPLRGFGEAARG